MRILKLFIIIFCLCVLNSSMVSQDIVNDAQLRLSLVIEKKLNNNLTPHIKLQHRQTDNFLKHLLNYIDIGASYKLNKFFTVSADYFFIERKQLDNSFSTRHRYSLSLVSKLKKEYWTFSYRSAFQSQLEDFLSSENGKTSTNIHRHKFAVQKSFSRLFNVYIANESYYPIFKPKNPYLSKNRTTLGVEYNASKNTQLDLYFLYQREFNRFGPSNNDFIYGFTYTISL